MTDPRLTESELAELKTCVNFGGFLSHTVARRIIELESTLTTTLAAAIAERDAARRKLQVLYNVDPDSPPAPAVDPLTTHPNDRSYWWKNASGGPSPAMLEVAKLAPAVDPILGAFASAFRTALRDEGIGTAKFPEQAPAVDRREADHAKQLAEREAAMAFLADKAIKLRNAAFDFRTARVGGESMRAGIYAKEATLEAVRWEFDFFTTAGNAGANALASAAVAKAKGAKQ